MCDTGRMEKTIDVDKGKFLIYKKKYYHYDCFTHNLDGDKIKLADKLVEETRNDTNFQNSVDRDRLFFWLYDFYDVVSFNKSFFQKMNNITKGTYKESLIVPISYYDLLQIYINLKKHLVKQYERNIKLGKEFTAQGRADYDLAIVLNNYNDYVKWKEKQKSGQSDKDDLKQDMKAKLELYTDYTSGEEYNSFNIPQGNINSNSNDTDIQDILDEIFD